MLGRHLIRIARKQRGMTQQDVADFVGWCGRKQISAWESGINPVPYDAVIGIVEGVCGLDIEQLRKEATKHENHQAVTQ